MTQGFRTKLGRGWDFWGPMSYESSGGAENAHLRPSCTMGRRSGAPAASLLQ